MFEKVEVNANARCAPKWMLPCCVCCCSSTGDQHELWAWLQNLNKPPDIKKGTITWNFDKFLVGRDGVVRKRWVGKGSTKDGEPSESLPLHARGGAMPHPLTSAIDACLREQ
eukprot:TRINITY_DN8172_c0_g1_i5.p2 TRINITY_DN8172_c0_g1~~TRINITY_DN8172_c0_g1_i5.p2  ORF type:complete len:112 (+),score=36.64 TRINITY_DN8172_c0_g1_i5:348-683(+)